MSELTKEDALRLVRENAWEERTDEVTCGHPGCEDHRAKGRLMIHTFSAFGCDVSLESAEKDIAEATEVGWVDHLLRHDLAIIRANRMPLYFDVPRPVEVPDA
jgi:hypothetical protein